MIKSYYNYRRCSSGREFVEESLAVPNLATDIKQLVADYSVGQLPSIAELNKYYDFDKDSVLVDNDEEDLRFSDRADMFENFLSANSIRRTIFERVKKNEKIRRDKEREELESYRKRYGSLQEDIPPEK